MNRFILADAASGSSFDAGLISVICLVLGIVFLILSVLFFFLFDIPKVFSLRTGKGARKTVKRMKEINAQTGRLRKTDEKYMLSTDVVTTDDMRKKPHPEMHKPFKPAQSADQPAANPTANSGSVPQDGSQTTVLGQTETTILASNETTVLSEDLSGVPTVPIQEYRRTTTGRFDITFQQMLVHSDEIIS